MNRFICEFVTDGVHRWWVVRRHRKDFSPGDRASPLYVVPPSAPYDNPLDAAWSSYDARASDISPFARQALRELIESLTPLWQSPYVFPVPGEERFVSPRWRARDEPTGNALRTPSSIPCKGTT